MNDLILLLEIAKLEGLSYPISFYRIDEHSVIISKSEIEDKHCIRLTTLTYDNIKQDYTIEDRDYKMRK